MADHFSFFITGSYRTATEWKQGPLSSSTVAAGAIATDDNVYIHQGNVDLTLEVTGNTNKPALISILGGPGGYQGSIGGGSGLDAPMKALRIVRPNGTVWLTGAVTNTGAGRALIVDAMVNGDESTVKLGGEMEAVDIRGNSGVRFLSSATFAAGSIAVVGGTSRVYVENNSSATLREWRVSGKSRTRLFRAPTTLDVYDDAQVYVIGEAGAATTINVLGQGCTVHWMSYIEPTLLNLQKGTFSLVGNPYDFTGSRAITLKAGAGTILDCRTPGTSVVFDIAAVGDITGGGPRLLSEGAASVTTTGSGAVLFGGLGLGGSD